MCRDWAWDSGFLGFLGFRVWELGCRVQGLGVRAWALGL